ncbi:MAG: nucleotide exchange factor GrpE [Aeromicrobium sp.]
MTERPDESVTPDSDGTEVPPTEASQAAEPEVTEPEPIPPSAKEQLAERTADLQRLQAEYINYKRRVDRDRVLIKAQGEASVLRSLLTVLDDIGRAADHGELEGGFKAVADALQGAVKSHKLEAFGVTGDEFDPRLHEALFHAGESADVTTTTVDSVLRAGYRVGDDILRHAQVSVIDPASVTEPVVETDDAQVSAAEAEKSDTGKTE